VARPASNPVPIRDSALNDDLCRELISDVAGFIVQSMACVPDQSGYETIVTPFSYPDADHIEVFVQDLGDGRVLLTDMGQTMLKLASYGFVPSANSPRRRAMIYQVVASSGLQYEDGSILTITSKTDAAARLWDVAVASQRLSDLAFTVPSFTKATFSDTFENYAAERGFPYSRGVPIRLAQHQFTADFVIGPNVIQLISAGSPGYARERVNSVYTNFAEMERAQDPRPRIAVIDDRQPTIDVGLAELLSHQADGVFPWSRKNDFERALAVA
jgi:hypothetical protein